MLKIVLCADTHLGFDYPIRPRIARRRRGKDFIRNFQRIMDFAVENEADYVVHGGDFFFRSKLPEKVITIGYEMLLDFSGYNIPFLLVPGNHERSQLPPSLFVTTKNIHIFDKPRTFQFEKNNEIIHFHGFPYAGGRISEQFYHIMDHYKVSRSAHEIHFLCMHQIVEGARLEHYTFRHGLNVIPRRQIPEEFDCVVSGHIHRAQILYRKAVNKKIPIIYPGSVERTSFQEEHEEKGFYVMECEKDNWIYKWNTDFIPLETRPMLTLDLDKQNISPDTITRHLRNYLKTIDYNAVVRIRTHDHNIRRELSAQTLRDLAPSTMNMELSPTIIP